MKTALEFRMLTPPLADALGDFFEALAVSPGADLFHPHPLTRAAAHKLCNYTGADLFLVAVCDERVLAYGLLRGWEEGYKIPSLGIALASEARGTGLARAFMLYLHGAARLRGAEKVRLTVYRRNTQAVALYRSLGYRFEVKNEEEEIGFLELGRGQSSPASGT